MTSTPAAGRGRPRSRAAQANILRATGELLVEQGYDALTMVAIAERSRVGKQTLYRWWPSKALLVTECVLENSDLFEPVLASVDEDAIGSLRRWLRDSRARLADAESAALFRGLMAAAATDADSRDRLNSRFTHPLRDSIARVLDSGTTAGQIRSGIDAGTAAQLMVGAMMHALIVDDSGSDTWADRVLDIMLTGIGARSEALPPPN